VTSIAVAPVVTRAPTGGGRAGYDERRRYATRQGFVLESSHDRRAYEDSRASGRAQRRPFSTSQNAGPMPSTTESAAGCAGVGQTKGRSGHAASSRRGVPGALVGSLRTTATDKSRAGPFDARVSHRFRGLGPRV